MFSPFSKHSYWSCEDPGRRLQNIWDGHNLVMSLTLLFGFLTVVCTVDMKAGYSLAIDTLEEELIGKRFKLSSSSLNRRKTEYTKYNVCLQPGEQMGQSIWELDPLLASSLRCVCLSLLVDLLHRNPQPFHCCDF